MQAKKRYILVFVSCAFLAYCYFGGYRLKSGGGGLRSDHTSSKHHKPHHISSSGGSSSSTLTATHHASAAEAAAAAGAHSQQLRRRRRRHFTLSDQKSLRTSGDLLGAFDDDGNECDRFDCEDEDTFAAPRRPPLPPPLMDDDIDTEPQHNAGEIIGDGATIADEPPARQTPTAACRMETCFDYSKCYEDFLVYVYPTEDATAGAAGAGGLPGATPPVSLNYQKIIAAITESRYYTADPQRACLFVLGIDTLDRDSLSEDYVRNVPARLHRLAHWNGGRNHLLFNLYSGTWPQYAEHSLGFDTGHAMLAKASMSWQQLRPGFDISLPLFHKQHPLRAGGTGTMRSTAFPANKKYLLAFKGKRYVHGIGSETRNSLFHLHNGRDLVLVTTCRHGKSWREMQDARCDEDNREYDRYDYETLLLNSTFCLVPRGRRLGSFRFLEVLQAGCIPVLLSNAWVLPFQSRIDWTQAVVWADERLLLQVPETVRSIDAARILALRQQSQVLWERYFGSIEKIVFTTLEIIRERLPDYARRSSQVWNTAPGALLTMPQFADSAARMPFALAESGEGPGHNFTAMVYVQIGQTLTPNVALYRLVRSVARSQFVNSIIILWASDRPLPPRKRWPSTGDIPLHIVSSINDERPTISHRFYPHPLIRTDAVLSLDEDAILNTDELDFAYRVWRDFPDRIVGYPARAHFWDDSKNAWGYTSKWTNYYSIVLTGAAVYHRYYNYLYTHWLSKLLLKTVQQSSNCEDILMNMLVSHVTRKAPIKVTQRKGYKDRESGRSPWNDPDHFIQRQSCLNTFAAVFGYMPLLRSNVRLDPVLYRDPVSNLRKKYRQIEQVGS